MQSDARIREELTTLLRGGHSHMSLEEAVADFPTDQMNAKPPNSPYSCWHILEHMRIALWDIVEYIRDPNHVSPSYPEGYRPRPEDMTDEAGWRITIDQILGGLDAMDTMLSDPQRDVFEPLEHDPEYTLFRGALTAAEHMSYHTGELAMMRQILDLWPEGDEYLTG